MHSEPLSSRRIPVALFLGALGVRMLAVATTGFDGLGKREQSRQLIPSRVALKNMISGPRPLFVPAKPSDIGERWNDQAPGLNIQWLGAHGPSITVALWGNYRLSRFERQQTKGASDHQEAPAP